MSGVDSYSALPWNNKKIWKQLRIGGRASAVEIRGLTGVCNASLLIKISLGIIIIIFYIL